MRRSKDYKIFIAHWGGSVVAESPNTNTRKIVISDSGILCIFTAQKGEHGVEGEPSNLPLQRRGLD